MQRPFHPAQPVPGAAACGGEMVPCCSFQVGSLSPGAVAVPDLAVSRRGGQDLGNCILRIIRWRGAASPRFGVGHSEQRCPESPCEVPAMLQPRSALGRCGCCGAKSVLFGRWQWLCHFPECAQTYVCVHTPASVPAPACEGTAAFCSVPGFQRCRGLPLHSYEYNVLNNMPRFLQR